MLRFPKRVTGAAAGAALFMLGIMSGHAQLGPNRSTSPSAETSRQLELLGKVLDAVRSHYVDATDDGKLIASAISGILGALDPHSSYMDAKSYSNMRASPWAYLALFLFRGMPTDTPRPRALLYVAATLRLSFRAITAAVV
jgi:hypothetical protein